MLSWKWIAPVVIALAIVLAVNVSTPKPAEAFIDEIIAAYCNGDAEPGVVPPGQVKDGQSLVRALQATGFIESIDFSGLPAVIKITFNPDVPNSKFVAHTGVTEGDGHDHGDPGNPDDVTEPGDPGEPDFIFTPHIVVDSNFPAFAHCPRFNP